MIRPRIRKLAAAWGIMHGCLDVSAQTNLAWVPAWTSLSTTVGAWGMLEVSVDGTGIVQAADQILVLSPGSRKLLCNGVLMWMHAPFVPTGTGGGLVSGVDARSVIEPLLTRPPVLRSRAPPSIVLDPGHGGTDTGARSACGLCEKDLTLDLARRIRRRFRSGEARVILTRNRDRTLSLADRVRVAQQHDADLFISLHLNWGGSLSATGVETYVLPCAGAPPTSGNSTDWAACPGNAFDAQNTRLGQALQAALVRSLAVEDRGVRRARFEVLKQVNCPAALVECGFLSHPGDARRWRQATYRETVARAVAAALAGLLRELSALSASP